MAVILSADNADTYFAADNHIMAAVWAKFTGENQKAGAIAHALRLLNRTFLLDIENDETVDADAFYHPDRAVYEQALFTLINSDAISNGESTGPKFFSVVQDGKSESVNPNTIAPDAKRWLGYSHEQIMLLRG